MTRKERVEYLNQLIIPDLFDNSQEESELRMKREMALWETIEEFKQEPCADIISRQVVINRIANTCFWLSADNWVELMKCIDSIPPANPVEKVGHWEWIPFDYAPEVGNWCCSECKNVSVDCVRKDDEKAKPTYKYCSQCGCKMEV